MGDFEGIEARGNERIDCLHRFVKLEKDIASHNTLGRLSGLVDRRVVAKSIRRRVSSVLPNLDEGSVIAIDGKASGRGKMTVKQTLYQVSAFATTPGTPTLPK